MATGIIKPIHRDIKGMVHIMIRLVFSTCSLPLWLFIWLVFMEILDMKMLEKADITMSRKAPMYCQFRCSQIFQVGSIARSSPRKSKFITKTRVPSPRAAVMAGRVFSLTREARYSWL